MTNQYNFYLLQFRQCSSSQSTITAKDKFYMQTCSLTLSIYLCAGFSSFSYTRKDILYFLTDQYYQTVLIHSYTVTSWSESFLDCIACFIRLISSCCWYGCGKGICIKLVTPCERTSHNYVQALVQIIGHTSFYDRMDAHWCNQEAILIDSTLCLLMIVLQTEVASCSIQSITPLTDILLAIAETSPYDRIVVPAYRMLAHILSDDRLKELIIANSICQFFFHVLEQSWKHPLQMYKQIQITSLFQGKYAMGSICGCLNFKKYMKFRQFGFKEFKPTEKPCEHH
ncbi:unnamed protein product [Rotaria magnacalcarata]|uniref:Uncharacterized protein n=1 Tax=Rotaria magnacalcarata TaxID=392030 RepID=A0A817A0T6_9BILA|nr:unnamed protein product [Rotaria magnacalcarata]CAF4045817.1 unnamed protein product [Rotaria magnacalcarata]